MNRQNERRGGTRKDPQTEEHPRERTVAPPIEREHETQQGVYEEDEKREKGEQEHERG